MEEAHDHYKSDPRINSDVVPHFDQEVPMVSWVHLEQIWKEESGDIMHHSSNDTMADWKQVHNSALYTHPFETTTLQ